MALPRPAGSDSSPDYAGYFVHFRASLTLAPARIEYVDLGIECDFPRSLVAGESLLEAFGVVPGPPSF